MRSTGDDGVKGRQPHPDEGGDRPFDPGIETGYLRRATRDHDLDPELGAVPFDPGAGTGYDDRRARRETKRRARRERARRERELKAKEESDRRRRASLVAESRSSAPGAAAAALAPEPATDPDPQPAADPDQVESSAHRRSDPEAATDQLAPIAELHALRPRRRSLAERLERERAERERVERERRAEIEREREDRERERREGRERRRREREERLRRDREALRRARRAPRVKPVQAKRARPPRAELAAMAKPKPRTATSRVRVAPARAPATGGPSPRIVRPRRLRHRDLVWPTAKAGVAVTVVLGLAAGLGSLLGLPVPGLNPSAGQGSLVSSATLFGVDPGTAPGLAGGFVFPVGGSDPHNYGEAAAKFGADRYGHAHEGQDIFGKPGTPLYAVRDGIVLDGTGGKSFYAYGGGNSLVLYSPTDDRSYVYLHMLGASPLRAGDQVHAGQPVGQVGCTGSCDGPHLHFEIRRGKVAYGHEGKPLDPLPLLRQWELLGTG